MKKKLKTGNKGNHRALWSQAAINTGPSPNKEVLAEYHARMGQTMIDRPASTITQDDLNKWEKVRPVLRMMYTNPAGQVCQSWEPGAEPRPDMPMQEQDPAPPRVRVMMKLQAEGLLRDYYAVSMKTGTYVKVDLFFGSQVFFMRENTIHGTIERSMTFKDRDTAKDWWFNHQDEILWFHQFPGPTL